MFKSSSMFRGVVTMNNGTHKIIRVGVQMVARITTMFKEEKKNVFLKKLREKKKRKLVKKKEQERIQLDIKLLKKQEIKL